MSSKYVDVAAITQVIGCVFNDPSILDNKDTYIIHEEDFVQEFHKIVFGSMYNIQASGSHITIDAIVDYLANRPKFEAIFNQNKGIDYLAKASENADRNTFNYYYGRLKKFTLLRAYDIYGIDVSDLYDPFNIIDVKKKQAQEDWLDNTSLVDIANLIDKRVDEIKSKYIEDDGIMGHHASEGMRELVEELKKHPEVGIPLYGPLINTVTLGARLRKFYLRSAATGVGKSRTLIADACNFACDRIYHEQFGWIKNGTSEPTLFIATEQDRSEVQTMILAFLSNVNEEHIIKGRYVDDEEERVQEAINIVDNSPLWVEYLPDFSLQDVENRMKRHIREHDVRYILFDYIQTSMKILEEVTHRSGGVRLREDNILYMLSARLKDLANTYGVFIMSGTQLSGDFRSNETPDQTLLRGAKSIGDKCDVGLILLDVTKEDLDKIKPILDGNPNFKTPNIKMSVYKNRRGAYKGVYLWCAADLGTCRIHAQFATKWNHEFLSIEDTKIEVEMADWES